MIDLKKCIKLNMENILNLKDHKWLENNKCSILENRVILLTIQSTYSIFIFY